MMARTKLGVEMVRSDHVQALIAFAALISTPAMAHQLTGASDRLIIGFYPTMERGRSEMTRIVEQSSVAVVGNDSDFAITGDPWIPGYLTLIARDPRPSDFAGISVGAIRLGQISTGEAEKTLHAFLPRAARRKQLLQFAQTHRDSNLSICGFSPADGKCLGAEYSRAVGPMLPIEIRNNGRTNRYVALIKITTDMAATLVPLRDDAVVVPLSAGTTLSLPPLNEPGELILLASDSPFDPAGLAQSPFAVPQQIECVGKGGPRCSYDLPPLTLDNRWTASAIVLGEDDDEPKPAMGGGFAASRGDADWTVELYDTTPYTKAEIAADSALPVDKTKFPAERTPEERAHACGGTLIATDIVITAAHCVAKGIFKDPNMKRVFTGRRIRLGTLRMGKGGETRAIVGLAVHSDYDPSADGSPNDIALLLIRRDETGIHLQPRSLALGTERIVPNSDLVGLGWGFTETVAPNANIMSSGSTAQRNPILLQQASLAPLSFAECRKRLKDRVKPTMICLVTPKQVLARGGEPTFSCRGDSGGPLVRDYGRGTEELVGLTSWSLGCGYKDTPSVYTDVTQYDRWIAAARAQLKPGVAIKVTEPARAPRAARRR
ncbi:MAG: serine protease [Sphingomicrobium sp.]